MERKNLFSALGIGMVAILCATIAMSSESYAVTRAMTSITNTASVNYKNQSSTGDYNATASQTLLVAYKVVINAPDAGDQTPVLAAANVTVPLTITNDGNYTDSYDVKLVGMFKDANTNGTKDADEPYMGSPWTVTYAGTDITNGTTAVTTPALDDAGVGGGTGFSTQDVVVTLPNIPDYNDNYVVVLEVKSKAVENTPAGLHIVNAAHAVQWKLPILIRKPHLVVSVTPPAGGSKVPGTSVSYTVNVANNGPIALAAATLTFPLPAALTGTTPQTFSITNLAAGANVDNTVTGTIERTSNNGTGPASGTSITVVKENVTAAHSFFGYAISEIPAANIPFTVDRAKGVSIAEYAANKVQDIEPNATATYYFKVKNEGNAASADDYFAFAKQQTAATTGYHPSDMSESYTYYIATGEATDPADPTTATYSASSIGTGASFTQSADGLSGGQERWVKVVVLAPDNAQNGESRTFAFQLHNADATPNPVLNVAANTTSAQITGYQLTVKAPMLSITLEHEAISGESTDKNAPYPGDVITFLITVRNDGTMIAKDIIVTQLVPATMTFMTQYLDTPAQGILFGATECTNANDGDAAYLNGSTVTTKPFTLAVGATQLIRFKAKVN